MSDDRRDPWWAIALAVLVLAAVIFGCAWIYQSLPTP